MQLITLFRTVAISLTMLLLASCATLQGMVDIQQPTARVAGVSIEKLSLDQVTLLVDVNVANPNAFALDIAGFDMNLAISEQRLASVNQSAPSASVPAKGEQSIPLPVTLKFSDVAAAVDDLSRKNQVDYALDGRVRVNLPVLGNIDVPLNFSDTLPIPKLPKIRFSNISLSDVSWGGAKMLVSLDVENPNAFGVDLNSLAYNLQAEGKAISTGSVDQIKLEQGQAQKVDIPLEVSLTNLGISLFRMLSGGKAVDIGIDGSADVTPSLGIWKPEPVTFNAKQTLNP